MKRGGERERERERERDEEIESLCVMHVFIFEIGHLNKFEHLSLRGNELGCDPSLTPSEADVTGWPG